MYGRGAYRFGDGWRAAARFGKKAINALAPTGVFDGAGAALGGAIGSLADPFMGPLGTAVGAKAGSMIGNAVTGRGAYGDVMNRTVMGRGAYNNTIMDGENFDIPDESRKIEIGDGGDVEDTTIIVSDTEVLFDVYGPAVGSHPFNKTTFTLNPGDFITFPKLSQIAANYKEYEFDQLVFKYETTIPTNYTTEKVQEGTILMATQTDFNKPVFQTADEMEKNPTVTIGPIGITENREHFHGVECDPSKNPLTKTHKYVKLFPTPGTDEEDYDHGRFTFATWGLGPDFAGVKIGQLSVYYRVKLKSFTMNTYYGLSIPQTTLVCNTPQGIDRTGLAVLQTDTQYVNRTMRHDSLYSRFGSSQRIPARLACTDARQLETMFWNMDKRSDCAKLAHSNIDIKLVAHTEDDKWANDRAVTGKTWVWPGQLNNGMSAISDPAGLTSTNLPVEFKTAVTPATDPPTYETITDVDKTIIQMQNSWKADMGERDTSITQFWNWPAFDPDNKNDPRYVNADRDDTKIDKMPMYEYVVIDGAFSQRGDPGTTVFNYESTDVSASAQSGPNLKEALYKRWYPGLIYDKKQNGAIATPLPLNGVLDNANQSLKGIHCAIALIEFPDHLYGDYEVEIKLEGEGLPLHTSLANTNAYKTDVQTAPLKDGFAIDNMWPNVQSDKYRGAIKDLAAAMGYVPNSSNLNYSVTPAAEAADPNWPRNVTQGGILSVENPDTTTASTDGGQYEVKFRPYPGIALNVYDKLQTWYAGVHVPTTGDASDFFGTANQILQTPAMILSSRFKDAAPPMKRGNIKFNSDIVCGYPNMTFGHNATVPQTGGDETSHEVTALGRHQDSSDLRGDTAQHYWDVQMCENAVTIKVHIHLGKTTHELGRNQLRVRVPVFCDFGRQGFGDHFKNPNTFSNKVGGTLGNNQSADFAFNQTNTRSEAALDFQSDADGQGEPTNQWKAYLERYGNGWFVSQRSVTVKQYNAHNALGDQGKPYVNCRSGALITGMEPVSEESTTVYDL